MIQFELPQQEKNGSIIKVIGVGGGGGNAVNYMYNLGIEGVDFVVCNTDMKALNNSPIPLKIQLGPALTQGLGAGANPEVGEAATMESLEEVQAFLKNKTKMAFITAGMGGGTGTGGAPIVAQIAKELGILTVGIVTTPFTYEGKKRMKNAEAGIDNLRQYVDTILVISNDKLRHQFGNIATSQAFSRADDILATATKCVTDVINSEGHIIVDFADVCTVMKNGGVAILGNAKASGENRALAAVEEALNSPLLNDNDIQGAKWILLNINSAKGEHEHTLDEMDMIQAYIQEHAGDDCDIIFGTGFDENLADALSVTIIATGFEYKGTQNAYDTSKKISQQEKNKITMKLGVEGEENKIFHSLENNQQAEIAAATEEVSNEPTMMIIEEPAIPKVNGMGFRFNKPQQVKASIIEEEKIIMELDTTPIVNEVVEFNTIVVAENKVGENKSVAEELEQLFTQPVATQIKENIQHTLVNATSEFPVVAIETVLEPAVDVAEIEMVLIEKTEQQVKDDYVTLKGITLNRKKGTRYLTDMELENEANFELQKKAFEERASKLRGMSFNVNQADESTDQENTPAYMRKNVQLENHPKSGDEIYSTIAITDSKNSSPISTINTFLHGKKPD
jgi:cell division protein FtsZ